jgi:hypothetical protein
LAAGRLLAGGARVKRGLDAAINSNALSTCARARGRALAGEGLNAASDQI